MINQLVVAGAGYTLLAIVSILDKFILDKSVRKPSVYAFYSTIFFFLTFLALPWTVPISARGLMWALISGVSFGFATWAMFIALGKEGASHIVPFIGAVVAVATFFFSSFILGEVLGIQIKIGLAFLVCASLLLSFKQKKGIDIFGTNFLWAIVSGILFGLSHVSAKYMYTLYPFFTGLVWSKGAAGIVGIVLLCVPSVRKALAVKGEKGRGGVSIVVADKIFGIAGVVLVQYAIAIGSATVVNSLAGLQYAFMFAFILLLTKFSPKLFSEKFTDKEMAFETGAIVLTFIGLLFLSN